jgi:hypothetical protein
LLAMHTLHLASCVYPPHTPRLSVLNSPPNPTLCSKALYLPNLENCIMGQRYAITSTHGNVQERIVLSHICLQFKATDHGAASCEGPTKKFKWLPTSDCDKTLQTLTNSNHAYVSVQSKPSAHVYKPVNIKHLEFELSYHCLLPV